MNFVNPESEAQASSLVPDQKPIVDSSSNAIGTRIAREKTHWFERANERLSDWCSPLLVKETRQALKSRQFLYTYFLLLVSVATWVVIGISWNQLGSSAREASGRELLQGMFVLLAIPLGIVIPFSAYRSLAKEYEDGTIQLISVSTMMPHQILLGKLGSALLQMMVYLSVMAPCMLLGYLLRGVSLPQILFTLLIAVFASTCLTVLGLFLGGVTKGRGFGAALSLAFILLLAWICMFWYEGVEIFLSSPLVFDEDSRIMILMFLMHPSALALLLLIAAATQISFQADNHSTPLRIAMLMHTGLYVGTIVTILPFESFPSEGVGVCTLIAAHYWLVMGLLMVGEAPQMSRRIQRTLPSTWLGRSFKSLLMPGPGRGLLFALGVIWSCGLAFVLLAQFDESIKLFLGMVFDPSNRPGRGTTGSLSEVYSIAFLNCFYPSLYLSLAYLLAHWRLHRKGSRNVGLGPALTLVLGGILIALSMILASLVHSKFGEQPMIDDGSFASYCNWYWMFSESMGPGRAQNATWFLKFGLPMSLIIGFAMLRASRELILSPVAIPDRVIEDSAPVETVPPAGESIEEIFGSLNPPKEP